MDITDETPIQPIYDFNAPGQPILLYRGLLGGLSGGEYNGTVELSCGPKLGITWSVDPGDSYVRHSPAELSLLLHRSRGDAVLPAQMRGNTEGWSNGIEFGAENSQLTRVIAHWFNLPNWRNPIGLSQTTADGSQHSWMGRWTIEVDNWRITFDVRPNYFDVMRDLHKSRVFVMTHVMALSRADGKDFPIAAAESTLSALQMGISFALGRFVAPMLPVGFNADGDTVWESWRPSVLSH